MYYFAYYVCTSASITYRIYYSMYHITLPLQRKNEQKRRRIYTTKSEKTKQQYTAVLETSVSCLHLCSAQKFKSSIYD